MTDCIHWLHFHRRHIDLWMRRGQSPIQNSQPRILFHPIYQSNEHNSTICSHSSKNNIPIHNNNSYQQIATINGINRLLIIENDKINKPQQQNSKAPDNVDNITTHNLCTIFSITNQHIMLNHQYNNIIKSQTADIYPSSSSSTTSNSIEIKEATQLNFRKRIQHQLCYP